MPYLFSQRDAVAARFELLITSRDKNLQDVLGGDAIPPLPGFGGGGGGSLRRAAILKIANL